MKKFVSLLFISFLTISIFSVNAFAEKLDESELKGVKIYVKLKPNSS